MALREAGHAQAAQVALIRCAYQRDDHGVVSGGRFVRRATSLAEERGFLPAAAANRHDGSQPLLPWRRAPPRLAVNLRSGWSRTRASALSKYAERCIAWTSR